MTAKSAKIASPNTFSKSEWDARVDLAACYRLVALYGWDDLIFTHISARVPGPDHVRATRREPARDDPGARGCDVPMVGGDVLHRAILRRRQPHLLRLVDSGYRAMNWGDE